MSDDFIEYHYWQGKYIALMLKKEEYKEYNEFQYRLFFPNNWFQSINYIKKIEILKQAIQLNQCIVYMDEALDFEEGIQL